MIKTRAETGIPAVSGKFNQKAASKKMPSVQQAERLILSFHLAGYNSSAYFSK